MKQIRKNLLTNILCLLSNVVIGLAYTPYLVRELGVVAYGVLPLALLINQYIIILTDSLQNSVTRFYSIAYRRGDYHQASIYFSSTIIIALLLPLFVLPIVILLLPWIENVMHIPEELRRSVGLLFVYTCSSLFLSIISNCINITAYSVNRLDLLNYLKIARNLLKFVVNVLLFVLFSTDVANVGLSSIIAELFVLVMSITFYKSTKHMNIAFGKKYIILSSMKPVIKMLSWVSLTSLSSVFLYKMDSLLINNYFGLYYTGVLGSISEFGSYCISITSLIGVLYRPLMLIKYSEGNHESLVRTTIDGAYISGFLSCLLCGIVMGLSSSLIKIWLNEEIAGYSVWLIIKMTMIPITTFGSTFSIVNNLWNRVRDCALWSLIISLTYLFVSLFLLEMGIDICTFLCLSSIAAIMQGTVLHISVYSKIYPNSMKEVYSKLTKCILFFAIVFSMAKFVDYVIFVSDVTSLILAIIVTGILTLCIIPFFIRGKDIDALDIVVPIKTIISKYYQIKNNKYGKTEKM